MLANFKGKQNTSGFKKNSHNINRKGRPIDTISYSVRESLKNGDISAGMIELHSLLVKKGARVSLKDLLKIQTLAFARYYYMTGGDMKKYYRVMRIK